MERSSVPNEQTRAPDTGRLVAPLLVGGLAVRGKPDEEEDRVFDTRDGGAVATPRQILEQHELPGPKAAALPVSDSNLPFSGKGQRELLPRRGMPGPIPARCQSAEDGGRRRLRRGQVERRVGWDEGGWRHRLFHVAEVRFAGGISVGS